MRKGKRRLITGSRVSVWADTPSAGRGRPLAVRVFTGAGHRERAAAFCRLEQEKGRHVALDYVYEDSES